MSHTLKHHTKRAGLALAVATAISAIGITTAQAQTFDSYDFQIAPRTNESKEVSAGDLLCSWRESGLAPYAIVSYNCAAQAVGVLQACVYKNKIISDTVLSIQHDVSSAEHGGGGGGEGDVFIAKNNGTINGSTTASPEESSAAHQLCPHLGEVNGPEPEVEVVAARWCGMSITDTTNNVVGGQMAELFSVLQKGNYSVPTCADLIASPPTDGGGGGGGGGS
ncbi:MAG: hypothetical protein WCC36_10490 [Gammaproteobacteria bacterium]